MEAPVSPPAAVPVPHERLTTIAGEQAALSTQFAAQEAAHAASPTPGDGAPAVANVVPDPPA
jgi:hypothetical protein